MRIPGDVIRAASSAGAARQEPAGTNAGDERSEAHDRRFLEAVALARAARYGQAEQVLAQLEAERVLLPSVLDLRGRIHAQQGRYLEAEACWLRAAQLSPGDPRVRRALETLADERLRPPWMRAAIWTLGAAAAAILVFLVLNLGLGVADARYRAIDNHLYELEARLALQIERLDLRLDVVAPRPTASADPDPADRLPRPVDEITKARPPSRQAPASGAPTPKAKP